MATTRRETIDIDGLDAPAEIAVDRWGLPHLRASSLKDLFFLQGFNAARDRLWQIDLWRKRGLGLLAADFGPGYLAQDRAARHFLYRGDMQAEWAAYAPDTREICTAFTAGINAWVARLETQPRLLPEEFRLFGTRPSRWAPEDVVRIRSHARSRNAVSEVLRARVMAGADARTDLIRKNLEPAIEPAIPEGLDPVSVPVHALDLFNLAAAPVTFTPERLRAPLSEAWAWTRTGPLGDIVRDAEWEGSNNWVIHGSRTETGRPILASDPHRQHSAPSLRYMVHLSAPGFDAIGAGEPAVPGISLGHNGRIAFGLTLFYTDQEDVYLYETAPGDPNAYRYRDSWEPMTLVEETVAVKGAPDQAVTLKFTRHGPVLFEDADRGMAVGIRTVWSEPGTAAYLGSLSTMRAGSFDEFRREMRRWGTPAVNQVCADADGTIGWLPAGHAPIRPGWDGLLPVPGDGRYEWAGFLDPDELPCRVDPPEGYVATANEMNLPADWDHGARRIGHEWIENSRALRIEEVLSAESAHSVAGSCALQTDVMSLPARRMQALLRRLEHADPEIARALELLRAWDCRLLAESPAGALYELWWTRHLKPAAMTALVPDAAVRSLLAPGDIATLLSLLESPDERFGPDPRRRRDEMLLATLGAAFRDCAERMGFDPSAWAWGALHKARFEHAATPVADAPLLDVGPLPHGGSSSTPMNSSYRESDFGLTVGASVRLVIDVGDWDRSLWVNAPGQSGDVRSPHYADLAPDWASGGYFPLLYSRAAVDEATEDVLSLTPAGAGTASP